MKRTKSSAVEYLKRGFFKGAGIGATVASSIFAAAAAMNIFAPGQTISSTQINQNFAMAAPEGAVVASYLASCPEGWAPADGTNGTPSPGAFLFGAAMTLAPGPEPMATRIQQACVHSGRFRVTPSGTPSQYHHSWKLKHGSGKRRHHLCGRRRI